MQVNRLSVKYFVQGDVPFDLDALIPVFQRWIQEHALEGLLIDVADYKHVFQGPGVFLIGHEGDYSFDLRAGRAGVMYTFKREQPGTLEEQVSRALQLAEEAGRKLEAEPSLNGVRFNYGEAEIILLDRLNTPNTPEAYDSLRDTLQAVAAAHFQTLSASIESVQSDPRKCLTVRIAASPENVVG